MTAAHYIDQEPGEEKVLSRCAIADLSEFERRIVDLLVRGASEEQIRQAVSPWATPWTIHKQVHEIRRKLECANRAEVAALYYGGRPFSWDEEGA